MHDHDAPFDWNQIYTGSEADYEEPDEMLVSIISELTPGRALDVGCGAGGLLVAMAERGWTVSGVDISSRAIAAATQVLAARGIEAKLSCQDASAWRSEQRFDLITNSFALPQTREEQARLFQSCRDMLAPGGELLFKDFDKPPTDDETFSAFHCPSIDELREAFEGFEVLRAEVVETPPHVHHGEVQGDGTPWSAILFHARKPAS